ncbi:MAG: TonB family protein [Nitrospiraceae bacterium]
MSVDTYPNLFAMSDKHRALLGQRLSSMLAISLAFHFLLLLVAAGLRLPARVERPLSSYDVSLVSLPTPPRVETPQVTPPREPQPVPRVVQPPLSPVLKKIEPVQEKPVLQPKESPLTIAPKPSPVPPTPRSPVMSQPTPQSTVKASEPKPVPAPPVKIAPQPAPPPMIKVPEYKPIPLPASPPTRKILDRDILRGVTLPPEAPKLNDVSSLSSPKETKETFDPTLTQKDIKRLLGNLSVPEPAVLAAPPPPREAAQPLKTARLRPSVAEELSQLSKANERLQNEYKQKELMEAPRQVMAQSRPVMPAHTPQPQAVPQVTKTSLRNPITKIQALSSGPGANRYLQIVQQLISRRWEPYQVDPTAESFLVVVRFRLNRNGSVQDVAVEQTSGNGYFDDAGKRAVLRARPLPAFPADMSDQYLDAHFSFLVGEQAS